MIKKNWNSIILDGSIPQGEINEWWITRIF